MKREDFKQIIKFRSVWKIDKRKGDYRLPNGEMLHDYVSDLVESQMKLDNLAIRSNGDLCFSDGGQWNTETKQFDDYRLTPAFEDNETCSYDEMEKRIRKIIKDIV